jgi:hypothetical protein
MFSSERMILRFASRTESVRFGGPGGTTNAEPELTPCSLGLSTTGQHYFPLRTNQSPATRQQYFSLTTNQHQPSATDVR